MKTQEVKIRKGIPAPQKRRRGRPRKHPIDKLEVGDSLRLDAQYNSVVLCCELFVKNHQPKWEFRLMKVDANTTDVWRVR